MESKSSLNQAIIRITTPLFVTASQGEYEISTPAQMDFPLEPNQAFVPGIGPKDLGDPGFKKRHSLVYPYVAGAMANGIASAALVKTMAENGMLGFFGAGGLNLEQIEAAILDLKTSLGDKPFGFNLIHSLGDPDHEMATVKLYLHHGITLISAAAFLRITPALVYYRVKGIHRDENENIITPNRIIAKVSRIEIARQFFAPPPKGIISQLAEAGMITPLEAELSQKIPMARDLTAEADSGGHTDNRPALALMPTMMALKNELMETYRYETPLCVGMAGGIATPESAAAAFNMGAAYILTGSINQSCREAGICEDVKKMLCQAEQADVATAQAADMFEIGARVQVLKRGTLFAMRAEKLYQLYKTHDRFEDLPKKDQKEIQEKFLLSSFEEAWQSTETFFRNLGNENQIQKALEDPKHKMALVFRSYLGQSSRWAIRGDPRRRMDYQVWCGPAMGAFNQWARKSFLESHENRYAAEIGLNLLTGACVGIRASFLRTQGIQLPPDAGAFSPMEKNEILAMIL